jgi:hypothetical protein
MLTENNDGVRKELLISTNPTNSKGTGLQGHSCKEGVSALPDMKKPEALQTSNVTKYFI